MHVLATQLATLEEADVAVDLGQSPAEVVVLSFSDSDLSALAAAWQGDAVSLPTLRLASLKRLLAMGVTRTQADAFLNNIAFSPSVQTALVLHLDALKDAENRGAFIQLAADQSILEGDALFFLSTSRLLAELQSRGRAIKRIETVDSLPVAIGDDGAVIVADRPSGDAIHAISMNGCSDVRCR